MVHIFQESKKVKKSGSKIRIRNPEKKFSTKEKCPHLTNILARPLPHPCLLYIGLFYPINRLSCKEYCTQVYCTYIQKITLKFNFLHTFFILRTISKYLSTFAFMYLLYVMCLLLILIPHSFRQLQYIKKMLDQMKITFTYMHT